MSATVASNRDWRLETVYSIFTPIVDINSILSVKKRRLVLPSEVVIENYDLLEVSYLVEVDSARGGSAAQQKRAARWPSSQPT